MKTTFSRLNFLLFVIPLISACGPAQDTKSLPPTSTSIDSSRISDDREQSRPIKPDLDLKQGVEYVWYSDGSCRESENKRCLTDNEYRAICANSFGATKMASMVLVNLRTRAQYLYRNGDVDEVDISWRESAKYGCRMTIKLSGIYNGSSARETVEGGASTFIVSDDGKVLVHFASDMNF